MFTFMRVTVFNTTKTEVVHNVKTKTRAFLHYEGLVTGGEAEVVAKHEPRCFRLTTEKKKNKALMPLKNAFDFLSVLVINWSNYF
jgi:hypothetical protein